MLVCTIDIFFSPIYIFFFATILDSCFHSSSFLVSVFKRILYRSLYRAECWPAVTRTTVFVTGTIDSPLDHLEPLPPQKSEKSISFSQSIYFILRDFLNNRFKIVATSFIFCFYFVFSFFFSNCHVSSKCRKNWTEYFARQELRE